MASLRAQRELTVNYGFKGCPKFAVGACAPGLNPQANGALRIAPKTPDSSVDARVGRFRAFARINSQYN
jgi:hypothetical protein